MEEAYQIFQNLMSIYDYNSGKSPDLTRCKELLKKLRLSIANFDVDVNDSKIVNKQLLLSREVLEYGALINLSAGDDRAFENYINSLKPYYFDFDSNLPTSHRKYPLLGVYLLFLLVQNRIGEFHTELELIPDHSSRYISFVIELEQDKMEGSYNKICNSSNSAPDSSYVKLTERLTDTIRQDIRSSIETAYYKLKVSDAQKLLLFKNRDDLSNFILNETIWVINGDYIHIKNQEDKRYELFDKKQLIHEQLNYAQELDRII